VFQGQDLPAIAQRTLSQEPDFRQAVDHHAIRRQGLELFEDHPGGLTQLQVGGIEQALLLMFVQQALRRHQLENVDARQVPTMGAGAGPQLLLGFRQRDVEAAFTLGCSGQEEAQGRGGLARSRRAFDQEHPVAFETAREDVIETNDTRVRLPVQAS